MTDTLIAPEDTQTGTTASGRIVLGPNQYGKAEVRLVKITRDNPRHEIEDLNVTSQLRGDFAAMHLEGDNGHCVATDTQKNTVYAFAREGARSPEVFLLRLSDHFIGSFDWIGGGRWSAESYAWNRIEVDGEGHDHSFVRSNQEVRIYPVVGDGEKRQGLEGPHRAQEHRVRVRGLPEGPLHDTSRDDGPHRRLRPTSRPGGASPRRSRRRLQRRVRRRQAHPARSVASRYSAALQATLFDMGARCSRHTPRSPRSGCRCPTSTTSSSTSRPSTSTTRTRCSSPPTAPTGSSRHRSPATVRHPPRTSGRPSPRSAHIPRQTRKLAVPQSHRPLSVSTSALDSGATRRCSTELDLGVHVDDPPGAADIDVTVGGVVAGQSADSV